MTSSNTRHIEEVDMMREAREAQWTALSFLGSNYKKGVSPAKVNLFFDVLEKTENGYHDVVNIMHALAMHDVVYMSVNPIDQRELDELAADKRFELAGPNDNLAISIDIADKANPMSPVNIPIKDNLIYKAIDLLAQRTSHTAPERISVRVEKQIPAQAGLAGGSSNATTSLLLCAAFWGIDSHDEQIESCAEELGADVAFFLRGGCGIYSGTGAIFERNLTPAKLPIILVKPDCGVSTAKAYLEFDANPHRASDVLLDEALKASDATQVPLFNSLYDAAISITHGISDVREWLCDQVGVDSSKVLLCGSGSAQFAIVDNFQTASRIAANAKSNGFWAKPTTLSSLRAAVV